MICLQLPQKFYYKIHKGNIGRYNFKMDVLYLCKDFKRGSLYLVRIFKMRGPYLELYYYCSYNFFHLGWDTLLVLTAILHS